VILGGGGFPKKPADAMVDRMIQLAGGVDAKIVVIPTASVKLLSLPATGPLPPTVIAVREHLESRGAKHVGFLHTRDRQVADSEAFVKDLRRAKAVFLTGGASRVLDDLYHGTLVEREVKDLLKRGGVVVGDSAGAITLGGFWLDWDSRTNAIGKATDGLGVLPRVTVTPHVQNLAGDERTNDVFKYITAHPATIGINIQEGTFLVLSGSKAEVGGKGGVSFFDVAKDKTKAYLRLASGERHDFAK
jgi:cyanophycinase